MNIDGITGCTANVGDIETMSRQAIDLLSDDDKLNRFKEQAFKQANRFDIQNIVPQYEELYSRFCEMN